MNPNPPEHPDPSSSQDLGQPSPPPVSFEELYEQHYFYVWGLVYAQCRNADDAKEIAQEAFLQLWKQKQTGVPIANPLAWLKQVARRMVLDRVKSASQRRRAGDTKAGTALENAASREKEPSEAADRKEQRLIARRAVRRVWRQLSQEDKLLLACRAQRMTFAAIGELISKSTSAAHRDMSRLRARLLQELGHLPEAERDEALLAAMSEIALPANSP